MKKRCWNWCILLQIIKEKNKIVEAIQVSWLVYNNETRKREIDGLLDALETYNLTEGIILTDSEEEKVKINAYEISIIPIWKWLL